MRKEAEAKREAEEDRAEWAAEKAEEAAAEAAAKEARYTLPLLITLTLPPLPLPLPLPLTLTFHPNPNPNPNPNLTRAEARAIARLPGGPERPAPRDKLAAALDAAAVVEKKRLEAVEGPPGGPQEAARNWLRKASIAQVGPSELSGPLPPMAGPLLARLHMENEFFASPFRRAPSASGASSPKSPRSPREALTPALTLALKP